MYSDNPRPSLIFSLQLILFSAPLAAVDLDKLSKTDIKEKWGQVLFCQAIYKMPEVKPRLYDFDIEHCNKAGQLMTDLVARYSTPEQQKLRYEAERHAAALSYNTAEPYHSVAACREYCREVARIQDERHE